MEDAFTLTRNNGININHLSASTVNSFITSRYGFYQSKVVGAPFAGNIHTARGKAVEHAVNHMLEKNEHDIAALCDVAVLAFDADLKENKVPAMLGRDHRDSIPGLVKLAIAHYSEMNSRGAIITQHKIEAKLEGVSRTMLGYLDFFQPTKMVSDCKISSKSPSGLSQGYVLQGSLYRHATGLPVTFDFFVPNKTSVHKSIALTDDDFIHGLSYLTAAAKCIEQIQECDDPKEMMRLWAFPDLSNMFGNAVDIRKACADWNIIPPQ